ncbi:MAG TPA: NADH-quinone oxidoreductase subunit M [Elusimicrobiota bacterium]|nr:NADH-quinone oxidoreductase subunit M [Elusimicrobiota bacterium]
MGILSAIVFVPLAGALAVLVVPEKKRNVIQAISVMASLVSLALSVWLLARFDVSVAGVQFAEKTGWIPLFNVHYFLGVDGLSILLVALTTLLSFLAVVASLHIELRIREYFFWFLLLETGMLGVFLSLDFFLFYVFWEVMLVPMYFLVGIWGGPKKEYAAIKFFLYTLFGSVFILLGMLGLYFASDPHTFDMIELAGQASRFAFGFQIAAFLAFYLGFAIKIPAFPFHTWLPLAHVEAPTAVSVLLAGVLLKMGVYGLLRISYPILPQATRWFLFPLLIIAVINIVYGAFCAMAQKDMKRMVAYSSINHMGYCLLGMVAVAGSNAAAGLSGAVFQMVTHGLITGSLFLLVGVIYDRAHTRNIDDFGGLGSRLPVFTALMTVQAMASLGLPGLAGFISEFLCFLGAFGTAAYRVFVVVAVIGIVVTAAFLLKLIKDVFLGKFNEKWAGLTDMNARELIAVVPLVILTVYLGLQPHVALRMMEATVSQIAMIFKAG